MSAFLKILTIHTHQKFAIEIYQKLELKFFKIYVFNKFEEYTAKNSDV